jgi:eukaryotic-like serine/threonine-protein kinase
MDKMRDQETVLNGRYKLLSRAGSGGMATVYKAQDLMLGRIVAVKVLHESLSGDDEFLRRFRYEARAAANLTHPNIVTVHDIGQDDGREYIVMEFVEGPTLKQLIRDCVSRRETMPLKRVLDLSIQVCAGLGYAHRSGFVHCDVKPHNVLVTRDERVKVADFGIARALTHASLHDQDLVWGTPQYFSPEQAAGEPATPASDVYAIGVILFELLTGRLPFEAASHAALALKHMRDRAPLVTQFNPAVPEQIEQILVKVLAKEPAGRYRTADQLGRILATYRQSTMSETGVMAVVPGTRAPRQVQRVLVSRPDAADGYPEAALSLPQQTLTAESPTTIYIPAPATDETDWLAVALGLLATVALLGLIPLWYAVYLSWAG